MKREMAGGVLGILIVVLLLLLINLISASKISMNIVVNSPVEDSVVNLWNNQSGKHIDLDITTNRNATCNFFHGICQDDNSTLSMCLYFYPENISTSFTKEHSKNIFIMNNPNYPKHVINIECNDTSNNTFTKVVTFYFNSTSPPYLNVCVPNLVNTTWSEWQNLSCINGDKLQQSRYLLQYDSNDCEEFENKTFYEYRSTEYCDFCTPLIINGLWSEWENISCSDNDLMNQTRYLTRYDVHDCGEIENNIIREYREVYCKNPLRLLIISPNNEIYNKTNILVNLSSKELFSSLEYMDSYNPTSTWTFLCSNCDKYSRSRIFRDGNHTLTVRGTLLESGEVLENSTSFVVDTRKPQVSLIKPVSMRYTNGSDFYIKYTEDNCRSLKLIINEKEVRSEECLSGKYIEERFFQDLSSYNNQEIIYKFKISDVAHNSVLSRGTKVKVDTTSPEIKDFKSNITGRYVVFNMTILNENKDSFGKVEYLDNSAIVKQWKPLCTSLINTNICYKKMYLSGGNHSMIIRVKDDAGNSDQVEIELKMPIMTNIVG